MLVLSASVETLLATLRIGGILFLVTDSPLGHYLTIVVDANQDKQSLWVVLIVDSIRTRSYSTCTNKPRSTTTWLRKLHFVAVSSVLSRPAISNAYRSHANRWAEMQTWIFNSSNLMAATQVGVQLLNKLIHYMTRHQSVIGRCRLQSFCFLSPKHTMRFSFHYRWSTNYPWIRLLSQSSFPFTLITTRITRYA